MRCLGCGTTEGVYDGYCDVDDCHDAGVAADVARRIEQAEAEVLRWSDEHGFAQEVE